MKFRFRNILLIGGSLLTTGVLFFTDPNGGALTLAALIQLMTALIAVGFAHVARKGLFDYLDVKTLYEKAKQSATGAGLTFLGVCVVIYGLLGLFGGQVHAAEVDTLVPRNAYIYIPTLQDEKDKYWRDHPNLQT